MGYGIMPPESEKTLRDLLILHEGYRRFPYTDTTGHLTIGIGRNIADKGISYTEALYLLDQDLRYFIDKLQDSLPFFENLDPSRKTVLIDMCFNLGINGFLKFKNMIEAIKNKNWELAAYHIKNSKAYGQAPNRYRKLAEIMRTGIIANIQTVEEQGETEYA